MDTIHALNKSKLKGDLPDIRPGQTVVVHQKIVEGEKERTQKFEGTVIARRGSGISETITVRKIAAGVGVEKIFPLHVPSVTKIEILHGTKVRRAKLYYLKGYTKKPREQAIKKR